MRLDDDLKYFEEPEFKKILAEYEAARESGMPLYMDAEDLTDIAEYYSMVAEDEESSNECIDFALRLHPDAVDPQIFRARQYMLQDDIATARELCDAIEDQQHREVYFLRAELLVREKKANEACSMLLTLIDTIEDDRDYFIYDSGYIFVDYHEYEWAAVFANDLENIAPNWYKTWQLKADVMLGLEKNSLALKYIEKMLDVDPFCIESWNWRAEAYSSLGEYDKAVESTDYALAIQPDNERALQLKAWVLMQQGNYQQAHELYERLETINPDCEQHWLYDSYCMLELDDVPAAEERVLRAEEIIDYLSDSPDMQAIHEQYAQVLSREGNVAGALFQLDQAELLSEPSESKWDERLLKMRVYAENDMLEEALGFLSELLDKHRDASDAIFYHGILVLFDYAYYAEMLKVLNELKNVYKKVFEDYEIYCYMAYAAMNVGDDELALKNIRKAIDHKEPHLSELFEENFPGVRADELYDYYYNKVYGRWPES